MKAGFISRFSGSSLLPFAHLILELCHNFMPVVYPLFIQTMGLTYTQVGLVVLTSGMLGSLTQPFFGYLSDRWGSHRLTVFSIAWIGLLMGLVGFAPNYLMLILLIGLGALGSAAFHPAAASMALARSGNRPGVAISVFSVGGNLGSALSPLLVAVGIGWWGIQGTLMLAPIAVLASLYLHWQLSHVLPAENALVRSSATLPRSSHHNRPRNSAFLGLALIIIAVMCRSWFQVTLMTYLPEWIQSQGWSLAVGGQMLSVFLVSVSIGSLTGGTLSDYIGRWQVLALSMGLLGPAHWLFLMAGGFWQVVLIGLIGMLIGATFPVSLVMAQEIWPNRVGLASSLVMGLGWAPGGIGASVTGFVADQSSLTVGLQSLILLPLLGLGCMLAYAVLWWQRLRTTDLVAKKAS